MELGRRGGNKQGRREGDQDEAAINILISRNVNGFVYGSM